MSSEQLSRLVTNPAARTYLEPDGWWAELVLEDFAFLADFGYAVAEVHFHQAGHFIRYDGPKGHFYVSYEPGQRIEAGFYDPSVERFVPLDLLLAQHGVERQPVSSPADREGVAATLFGWAEGMKAIGPKVLTVDLDEVAGLSPAEAGQQQRALAKTHDQLHDLVRSDPERAWPEVVAFVEQQSDPALAQDLIEDFVYEHDDQFIARIESAAREDPAVSTPRGLGLCRRLRDGRRPGVSPHAGASPT